MGDDFLSSIGPTLDGVLAWTWAALERGIVDRRHPFRTGVLATSGAGGPRARTVVARACERERRIVRFHTDRRSGKLADLAAEPGVAWLFWHPGRKVQVRLEGRARVRTDDDLAEAHWRRCSDSARACYRQSSPPGAVLSASERLVVPEPLGAAGDAEDGRDHFAVVEVRVDALDWLHLRAAGHVRATFAWDEGGEPLRRAWVHP